MQNEMDKKRMPKKRKMCAFCLDHIVEVDYKQVEMLGRYINEYGRIKPRRQTGACAKHQRGLAIAVKRARHLALLPFVAD